MNAISQLSNLPETREQIATFVESAVAEITSGERNPLEFEVMLKAMEELVESIRKDVKVKNAVQNAANLYPEKSFKYNGATITKVERDNMNYASCGDSQWERCDANERTANEQKKQREAFLKYMKEPIADPQTGEIIKPPTKSTSSYITVKLK